MCVCVQTLHVCIFVHMIALYACRDVCTPKIRNSFLATPLPLATYSAGSNVNATRNDYHLFICLLIHSFILSFLRLLFLSKAKLRRAHASMAQIAVVLQTAEQLLVRDLLKVPTPAVTVSDEGRTHTLHVTGRPL